MTKSNVRYDSHFWVGLAAWFAVSLMGYATAMAATGTSSRSTPVAALETQRDVRIDLHAWQQGSVPRSGSWCVDPGGQSVLQTLNGAPTMFLSAREFIDVTISGTVEVFDASDDDFIGFVFGYKFPNGSDSQRDFLLFDWRGGEQSSAPEGFTLSRVTGPVSNSAGIGTPWWAHTHPSMEVLATNLGTGKGWRPGGKHGFELTYMKDRVRITIDGLQIFDLTGEFESGQFGFYNFSQAKVRYSLLGYSPVGTPLGVAKLR